ncbi:MAG: ABC transporter ATP-binding protein [Ruminococcus sp.]|nr:ABC transporter ATP-binding protein [Ruminococcus sp.]
MLSLFKRYLGRYMPFVIATFIFTAITYVVQICFLVPESKNIIDNGVSKQNTGVIWQSGIWMIVFTLIIGVCSVFSAFFSSKATAGFTFALRRACFTKANSLSPQDFVKFGESTLVNRTMADVVNVSIVTINMLRVWMALPILLITELIIIASFNAVIFLILAFFFTGTVTFLVIFGARSKNGFERLQQKLDKINLIMKERIVGVRHIRAFTNEKPVDEKSSLGNASAYEEAILANKKINFLSPIGLVVMNWVVVLIYIVGTAQVQHAMASISGLLLIFQYISYFILSLMTIPYVINLLPKGVVSAKRIKELLDFEPTTYNSTEHIKKEKTLGKVEFRNVVFGYSGALDVIADISFTAQPGKTTAFIGTTGSGKTTIMNLMQGLYLPTFGDILIDDVSIRNCDEEWLRSCFSYGTQRPMIFQDTVRNNISTDASEERIRQACDASCFSEILEGKEEGPDFMLSQGGMNLSGGQRQRLSLARTLAREAPIYVFDDTFSALDAHTEQKARAAIDEMLKDRTIIMVAQKISTVRDADHIIVLEKGRIAGQGKHEELMKTCQVYQEIYQTQCYLDREE